MLYILNVILPSKRNFKNSITALYGIGRIRALKLASVLGLHPTARIEAVDQRKLNRLGALIERSFLIDFELKRKISLQIRALVKIGTLRGFCHVYGLPTRGQRTHTNASTANKLLRKSYGVMKDQASSRASMRNSRFDASSKNRIKSNTKNKNKNTNKKRK